MIWGYHNDRADLDLVGEEFIAIGWSELGDLSSLPSDQEEVKALVTEHLSYVKPGAVANTAGMIRKFRYAIKEGDYVVYPNKFDRTINVGQITSPYYFVEDNATYPNRRNVNWLETGLPRSAFPKSVLYSLGSALTLFTLNDAGSVFISSLLELEGSPPVPTSVPDEISDDLVLEEAAQDEPSRERIEEYTADFIIEALLGEVDGFEFEEFLGDLFEAMGYHARVTQKTGDGGVDLLVYRDHLGVEPPFIKVQTKRTTSTVGSPEVSGLVGTLAEGGKEIGIVVSLGGFTKDALNTEKHDSRLRLIGGSELVELVLENYERLSPHWRRLLPLSPVYVVDESQLS